MDRSLGDQLIREGKQLSNTADRIYVLVYLASCLPKKRRSCRKRLFALAEEMSGKLESIEDRYQRYFTIAHLCADQDKPLASKALREAFKTITHTTGRRGVANEYRLVDLAYRVDPELPMELAVLHDDDPAREEYRSRAQKQISRYQLKMDIGDPRSHLDLRAIRNDADLATATWQALGGLNSGRLIATDIGRLRDMLVCASNYPLHTAYPYVFLGVN